MKKRMLLKVSLEHHQASIYFPDMATAKSISKSAYFSITFDGKDRVINVFTRGSGFIAKKNDNKRDPDYPIRAQIEDVDPDGFPRFRAMEFVFDEFSAGSWKATCPKFHTLPWPQYKFNSISYDWRQDFQNDFKCRLASAERHKERLRPPENELLYRLDGDTLDRIRIAST